MLSVFPQIRSFLVLAFFLYSYKHIILNKELTTTPQIFTPSSYPGNIHLLYSGYEHNNFSATREHALDRVEAEVWDRPTRRRSAGAGREEVLEEKNNPTGEICPVSKIGRPGMLELGRVSRGQCRD